MKLPGFCVHIYGFKCLTIPSAGPGTELRQRQSATVKPSGAASSPMPQPSGRPTGVPSQPSSRSPAVQLNKEPSQSLLSPSSSSEGVVIPPG